MKIVLFGPPGAGKGTQAEHISKMYGLPHISTGAVLRKNIEEKTPIGLVALEYIERGKLAPDDVMMQVLESELEKCENGFLLDGFPRTLAQAEALDKITSVDVVLNIEIDSEEVVDRILNRMVCPKCGKNYNKKIHSVEICDICGSALTVRKDDNEEVVRERLHVYENQTKPVTEHYRLQNKLAHIDGRGSIEDVFERIRKALYDYDKK